MQRTQAHPPVDGAPSFGEHAVAIAKRQYFQPAEETVHDLFRRVADWVATAEPEALRSAAAERFYRLMASQRFCPGGRVLAGSATTHGNVLNCFVQDGSPEEAGSDDWVMNLASKLALVTKVGGGNGLNLDPLPPKRGFKGPIGQLYLTARVDHPDIELIRSGTFLDLARGERVTRGYRTAVFVESTVAPSGVWLRRVGDSVEDIWRAAADMAKTMLRGQSVLIDLSDLRPDGTAVLGSGGSSSGPASFAVEVFDNFATWASLGGAAHAGPVDTLRYVFAPTLRAIRQGGCLHPHTLVHTSRGTLRLSELVDAHQYGWHRHHFKVATDDGFKDSTMGYNNGIGPTLKVHLANGQVIQGTARHRLKVMRPNGTRDWVRLDELQRGDSLIQMLDQHTGSAVVLRPVDRPHHNAKAIKQPEALDERLAFFLGYLWGDGFVSSGRVGMAVAHGSPMMQEAPKLFSELFGLTVTSEQKMNDASVIYVVKSSQLIAWLAANGLIKGKAPELQVPGPVRRAPRPALGAFLRGLFEADGSVVHGYPVLSSSSDRLAADVASLLGGLGIPTKLGTVAPRADRFSKKALFRVRVLSGQGLRRFVERVGVLAGSRLEKVMLHQPDTAREYVWRLPHAQALLEGALASLPAGAKGRPAPYTRARKSLLRYYKGARNLTATGYQRLRQDEHLSALLPELDQDEYYVPVVSVEDGGRSLTLDLTVEENSTYLANGFVSHNTRRGAGMATLSVGHPDVNDFITAKDLGREQAEGDISTFNISVLVSDPFMQRSTKERGGPLWDIAKQAWATGEPGLIYVDRINEHNPMRSSLGEIRSTNPCVTADTWVMTSEGARKVADLVGTSFRAVVDGKDHAVASNGFWSTGVKPVWRVKTRRGFELRLTANHRLRKVTRISRTTLEGAWCETSDLRTGDRIFLQDHRKVVPWAGRGGFEEGWLLGSLVGDGTSLERKGGEAVAALDAWGPRHRAEVELPDRTLEAALGRERVESASAVMERIERGRKTITDEVESASADFYAGFLRGLFDADGSVKGTQEKGVSVRLAQSDLVLLQRVQRMLARLGVLSTIDAERRPAGERSLPDGRGGTALYDCRADHELVISGENLLGFAHRVGFADPAKLRHLDEALSSYRREPNRERFVDEIVSIEADGQEEVFDVSVEDVHAFDANGITAHNCGEIPLYPGEPCDLGAINLAAYVVQPGQGLAGFDFGAFREDTRDCVRFLDDVLDVNVFALPDNRAMSMKLRRLGLGVMGLADALIRMGYAYDSEAGRAAVDQVISAMRDAATKASEDLARERGPFPLFPQSGLPTPRRNVAILTVAPTGTTSMLMGVSSGVEPVFAPVVHRRIGTDHHALVHPLFRELLEGHAPAPGFERDGAWDWPLLVEAVQADHGSVQSLTFVPEAVRAVMRCAHDIAAADHVRMQGVVQRAFDGGEQVANSISKTINMRFEADVAEVFDAYGLAFVSGCKGITVYRDGSRQFQVLSTGSAKPAAAEAAGAKTAGAEPAGPSAAAARRPSDPLLQRPLRLSGFTDQVKLTLPNGERRGFFVTVNQQDGLPAEVFIVSGKAGDEANADSEALGRVVSIALQHGVPAEALVKTLRGINGGMFGSYHGRMVASKADLLAVALETAGVENVLENGKACPDCGGPLRYEEGCQSCEACGYSKCG